MVVRIGTRITSTVSIPISVEILCEACDRVFSYQAKVEASASHSYATPLGIGVEAGRANAQSKARDQAELTLIRYLDRIKQGETKLIKGECTCPQCGYLQSWMAKQHNRPFSNVFASGFLFVLCMYFTVFMIRIQESQGTLLCGGASLVLAGVLVWSVRKYTYNANKQWFIDRGKNPRTDTPPARSPINIYLIDPSRR